MPQNAAAPLDNRLVPLPSPSLHHIYWAFSKCRVALGVGDTRQTQVTSRLKVETHKY